MPFEKERRPSKFDSCHRELGKREDVHYTQSMEYDGPRNLTKIPAEAVPSSSNKHRTTSIKDKLEAQSEVSIDLLIDAQFGMNDWIAIYELLFM